MKNSDVPLKLIALIANITSVLYSWSERCVDIEGTAAVDWYERSVLMIPYIIGHPPFQDNHLYIVAIKPDCGGDDLGTAMWAIDW